MAIALANDDVTNSIPRYVNGNDTVGGTPNSSNSGGPSNNGTYTPAANSLLVLIIGVSGTGDDLSAATGHGTTYSSVENLATTTLGRSLVYAADSGSSPTSTVASVTFATAKTGLCMYDLEFTGVDLTGGVAAAFVQKVSNSTTGATALQDVLAAASDSDNRPLTCCYIAVNEAITEDASYAEINDQGHNAPTRRLSASWQSSGFDTTVDHSWTTSTQGRSISMELKATGGGGGAAVSVDPLGMSGFFGV